MLSVAPFEAPPTLLRQAELVAPVVAAVANAGARLAMESARLAADAGIMTPVLVGERDAIRREADALGWDISGLRVVAAGDAAAAARTPAGLAQLGQRAS